MRITWLGWAGIEIEADGERVVVDPLADAAAVFRPLGEAAAEVTVPEVVPASGGAVAGLVTHLHRDHADAAALVAALAPSAAVHEPVGYGGSALEQAAVQQADGELATSGLQRREVHPWTTIEAGPFTLTALPAADGTGDPQVSWLVQAGGRSVLHLGDTLFHGWWWRIAERFGAPDVVLAPINGARLSFPNRRPASPLPGVMDPEQAVLAAELLRAERMVPIHHGGYAFPGVYDPVPGALERAITAGGERVTPLAVGATLQL